MEKTIFNEFFNQERQHKIKLIDGMDFYEPFLKKHFQTTQILTTKINELYKKNEEIQCLNSSIVQQIERIEDDNLNLHSEFRRTYLGMEDKMNYLINEFQNIMQNLFKSSKMRVLQQSEVIPSIQSLKMFNMRKFRKMQKENQDIKDPSQLEQQHSEKLNLQQTQIEYNKIYSQKFPNEDSSVKLQHQKNRDSNQTLLDDEEKQEISDANTIAGQSMKTKMLKAMLQKQRHPKALATVTQVYIDKVREQNEFAKKLRASEGSFKFQSNSLGEYDHKRNASQIDELRQIIQDLKIQLAQKFSEIEKKEKHITQRIQISIQEVKNLNSIELNSKISKINEFIEKHQKQEINTKNLINRMTRDSKMTNDQLRQHIEAYKRNMVQIPKKAIDEVKEWILNYERQSHDIIYKKMTSSLEEIDARMKDRVTIAYFHQTMKNLNHSLLEEFAECDNKFAFKRQTKRAFIFIEKKLNKLLEELYEKGQINVRQNEQLFEDLYFNVKQYHLQTLKQTQDKNALSTLTLPNKDIPKKKSLQMDTFQIDTPHRYTPDQNPFKNSQKTHKDGLIKVTSDLKHEKSLTTHKIPKQKHTRAASNYQTTDKFQKAWKENAQKILEEGPIKVKKRRVFFK